MKLLSIETSCDDTAISIFDVKGGATNASFKVLANATNSQIPIHVPYGGVYPMLAKREHAKNLPILLEEALAQAKIPHEGSLGRSGDNGQRKFLAKNFRAESGRKFGLGHIDVIAVTYGPGLEMCLWEGISFAKKLGEKWDVPVIPTNHMEGHVLSAFGKNKGTFKIPKVKFPMMALLVSGGHTQLVLVKKWMNYEIIGESLDDAVGEAFDKVARTLDLPYPGGPQISKLAESLRAKEIGKQVKEKGNQNFQGRNFSAEKFTQSSGRRPVESLKTLFPISLPRPMLHSKNFDFSFSGLKTSVLYLVQKIGKLDDKTRAEIALEFENAAIECLTHKTKKAIEKYGVKTLVVAGGVAANKHLRNEMKKVTGKKVKLMFPTPELSTDNSLMIGIAGYVNYIKNKKKVPKPDTIKATGTLRLG